jgi:mannose-6-phosphate isomerase-like protein (cupin superfamily)
MVVDGKEVVASGGEIIVIGPATPHSFTAIGNEPLHMVAIHHTDRFIIEPLEN